MILNIEQTKILSEWKIEWNKFYLQWQLDRKQYTSINEVLETIGLKWNRKEKAHIFDGEMLEEAIADIIESWECETLKETIKKFQFFPTPCEVADYLVELAEIRVWHSILEPSAWDGAILRSLPTGCRNITAIELDEKRYDTLKKYASKVECTDFLKWNDEKYQRIVMNPPFSKSQDVKHILHAYSLLSDGGILVSVASSSIKSREGNLYNELKILNPEFIELPEWSFKESGTMVNTVIVKITK